MKNRCTALPIKNNHLLFFYLFKTLKSQKMVKKKSGLYLKMGVGFIVVIAYGISGQRRKFRALREKKGKK